MSQQGEIDHEASKQNRSRRKALDSVVVDLDENTKRNYASSENDQAPNFETVKATFFLAHMQKHYLKTRNFVHAPIICTGLLHVKQSQRGLMNAYITKQSQAR